MRNRKEEKRVYNFNLMMDIKLRARRKKQELEQGAQCMLKFI